MSSLEAIAVIARAAVAGLVGDLQLHLGDELVARVVAAAGPDGYGLLALAGNTHAARLPAGLREGQKLRLRVVGEDAGALVLRITRDDDGRGETSSARVAGVLALRGDGELLRAALALAGPAGALALPDGASARVVVEDEAGDEGHPEADRTAVASVLLHSPSLGPIEVRLSLAGAGISAAVGVEPGRAEELAQRAAPELARALERAAARPASVAVSTRGPGDQRPEPPRPKDVFDAYA